MVALSAILEVVERQGWGRITIIYEMETLGYLGLDRLRDIVEDKGIHVLDYISLSTPGLKFDPHFEAIRKSLHATDSRIQVVLSTGDEQLSFLRVMKNAGFFDNDHVWITLNDLEEELIQEPDMDAYDGLIMVNNGVALDGFEPYDIFKKEWMSLNTTE